MKFQGIIPALITPLDANESVNTDVLKQLMHRLIEQGADGFYVGGATGEGLALRAGERKILAETAAKVARGAGIPCIVQVASNDFSTVSALAKHAEEVGADAISSTVPLFFAYDKDDVYQYYKKLAESVHIPLMVYYSPNANFHMDAAFAKRLFEIDNVTSIKWTSSDFYQMALLKEMTRGEMGILNGFDEMLLMGLCAGADGGIGATYNYQMKNLKGVWNAFLANDLKGAMEYQGKVAKTVAALNGEPVIPASKAVMEELGFSVGNATFPMKRYSDEEKKKIYERVRETIL